MYFLQCCHSPLSEHTMAFSETPRMSPPDSQFPNFDHLVAYSPPPDHKLCLNYELFILTMIGYYISFMSFKSLIKFTSYSSFVYSSFKFLFKRECSLIWGGADCLKMSKVIYKYLDNYQSRQPITRYCND